MDAVNAKGVKKKYVLAAKEGVKEFQVLDGVTLHARPGEFVGVLGPNGCGKSTLLRMLAGLEEPDEGAISVFGKSAQESRVGYVPQHTAGALLPWLNGLHNIAFGNEGAVEKTRQVVAEFGLEKYAHAFPHQLSGGLKQLFAIARSVLFEPDVFLMDEPFSALDYQNKLLVEERLLALREAGNTAVIVSHDIEPTVLLCDRIVVLSEKPARVKALVSVGLPAGRLLETRFTPEFNSVSKRIFDLLRGAKGEGVRN
ncbi:MAG: ATP-binding cassette domain-containing protein [Candidatus Micrarchaeota archaeon]